MPEIRELLVVVPRDATPDRLDALDKAIGEERSHSYVFGSMIDVVYRVPEDRVRDVSAVLDAHPEVSAYHFSNPLEIDALRHAAG